MAPTVFQRSRTSSLACGSIPSEDVKKLQMQLDTLKEQTELIQMNFIGAHAEMDKKMTAMISQFQQLPPAEAATDSAMYLKVSTAFKFVATCLFMKYCQMTMESAKVSKLGYTKALRHMHALMGIGIVGAIGSVQVAKRSEGFEKKKWLDLHKSSGVVMFAALLLRIILRFRSPIPPRYPGPQALKLTETGSHYLFYLIMLGLPTSGMMYTYLNGSGIPFLNLSKQDMEEEDMERAQKTLEIHAALGKFMQYAWMPFHFASMAYHSSKGRQVIKKITPFP